MTINYPAAILLVALVVCEMALLRYFPDQKELIVVIGTVIAALGPAVLGRKNPPSPPPPADGSNGGGPNLTLISGGALLVLVAACAEAIPPTTYAAQLEMCVSTAATLAQSQECRCRVNLADGRPCTPVPAHCHVDGSTLVCADAGAP
jgi:hypothetical protein